MGLRDRVARLARALVGDGGPPQQGPGVGGAAGKRVLVARLPTRLYPDGPAERSVAADGLYGLARITVHEAELWGAPSPSPPLAAAATAATAEPPAVDASEASAPTSLATLDRRARFYAVVSVGRQTFASKRVKGTAGARVAAAAGVNPAAAAAPGALRFEWHEGTDVVLQRSGASLAQVAIYKGRRTQRQARWFSVLCFLLWLARVDGCRPRSTAGLALARPIFAPSQDRNYNRYC